MLLLTTQKITKLNLETQTYNFLDINQNYTLKALSHKEVEYFFHNFVLVIQYFLKFIDSFSTIAGVILRYSSKSMVIFEFYLFILSCMECFYLIKNNMLT